MDKSKRLVWLFLCVLGLFLAVVWSCSDDNIADSSDNDDTDTCTFAGPRLFIPDSTFDFGYVPQYSKISHTFILRSTGCDTLRIVNVRPG